MLEREEDPKLLNNPVKQPHTDWGKLLRNLGSGAVILSVLVGYVYFQTDIAHRVNEVGKDIKEVKQEVRDVRTGLNTVESDVKGLSEDVAYIKGRIDKANESNSIAPTALHGGEAQ